MQKFKVALVARTGGMAARIWTTPKGDLIWDGRGWIKVSLKGVPHSLSPLLGHFLWELKSLKEELRDLLDSGSRFIPQYSHYPRGQPTTAGDPYLTLISFDPSTSPPTSIIPGCENVTQLVETAEFPTAAWDIGSQMR